MSSVLIATVAFTVDEAEFLVAVLGRVAEASPANSAERFWLERLHSRVHQDVMDVVANDASARLAASSTPSGMPFPPPPPPAPANLPSNASLCTCGYRPNSNQCNNRRANGTHP